MHFTVPSLLSHGAACAMLLADLSVLIYLIPILIWCFAAGWVLWDAVQRMGEWGWMWGIAAFGAAPLVLPLYLALTMIADRPAPAWLQREKELATQATRRYKAMGDIERAKFLEAAAGNGGTLYSGVRGMHPHSNGTKHFSDAHAEHLLGTQQYAAAFLYLYDLHRLATDDSDLRGEETYRHYILQLPEGRAWLQHAQEKQLSPGQLKAGGIALLEAWSQPPDRSRHGAAALPQQPVDDTAGPPRGGQSLEQLLSDSGPEPAAAAKPLSVRAARDPRAIKRNELPF